jgi:hypothetical protein
MLNLEKWQTFSHTHRTFNFEERLDSHLVQELKNLTVPVANQFHEIVFIEDKQTIQAIYDLSSLPANDQFKFKNFESRKNSQLLAPLLIMAIPQDYNHTSMSLVGELYSRLAHRAIKQGCQTGFCICYEKNPAEVLLHQEKYTAARRQLEQIPFLAIGHHDSSVPFNFQRRDVNKLIGSYEKLSADRYITVT